MTSSHPRCRRPPAKITSPATIKLSACRPQIQASGWCAREPGGTHIFSRREINEIDPWMRYGLTHDTHDRR